MQKVRNRKAKAARKPARSGQGRSKSEIIKQGPPGRAAEPPFMLRAAAPAFPADLIVPPHRGPVITAASWPTPVRKPAAPPPVIVLPAPRVEPEVDLARAPDPLAEPAPIPASRALAVRRQGFIDILAFALRDSGRRLARWSSARRRADDMKDKLAKAEARMRAMEAQLAALRAIQERINP